MSPTILKLIVGLGLPGLIGAGLGYWLLGTKVKDGVNILGNEPWHPLTAIVIGALVLGVGAFVFGLV